MISCKIDHIDNISDYEEIEFGYQTNIIYLIEKPNDGLGGILLKESKEYYNKVFEKHNTVFDKDIDFTNWRIIKAYDNNQLVGGAIICGRTKGICMLDSRDDLLVIWDLRVAPKYQRKGIGKRIISKVKEYAKNNDYNELKVESQNTNIMLHNFTIKLVFP